MLLTALLLLALLSIIIIPSVVLLLILNPASVFDPPRRRTALVLVLGDVGRSPRMMYHAESLAKLGWETCLVGYEGSTPLASLLSLPHVHIHYLPSPPNALATLPFILAAPFKILWQISTILWILIAKRSEVVLVQNPPSIPTLLLAQIATHLRGSKLIIDWHNTGYSILGLKLGQAHPIVNIARWFEATFGRVAYAHLFVTQAMKERLSMDWKLVGKKVVLHDRPPSHFRRSGPMTAHELFSRIIPQLTPPLPASCLPVNGLDAYNQLLTHISPVHSEIVSFSNDRPALIVSSTSWTPDEDFGVLLDGLSLYEEEAKRRNVASNPLVLPRLVVLISGKGPLLKTFHHRYNQQFKKEGWEHVTIRTLWLDIADYPKFLGSADLGISLHQSSSGLDLPMKVVDMFGCGIPVLARGFACINELVKEGKNGMVFDTAADLAKALTSTLGGFPKAPLLNELRSFFPDSHTPDSPGQHFAKNSLDPSEEEEWATWEQAWNEVVAPLIVGKPHE